MSRSSTGVYPPDWRTLSATVRAEADNRCVRCGHPDDRENGYQLTVHHLDMNPSNSTWWNLLALCQRCHLKIQAKVVLERPWLFEHSDWFKPYAAGWYAFAYLGEELSRDETMARLDELLALERRV